LLTRNQTDYDQHGNRRICHDVHKGCAQIMVEMEFLFPSAFVRLDVVMFVIVAMLVVVNVCMLFNVLMVVV